MLNHLRFLYIGTELKYLPASFSNLRNLETLLLENYGTAMVLLPRIWDLVKLRELHIVDCCFFDLDTTDESIVIAEDTKLEKLRCLVKLVFFYSKDREDIFKRFPNLQLLQFVLKESSHYSTEQHWFPKLDFLTELEDLEVSFISSDTNDSGSSAATTWSWDALSTIARLPNLAELSLDNAVIQGGEWNVGEEDTFVNLKYLELNGVTLAKWEIGEESFPVLEKLLLWGYHMIKEIPPSFGDIDSLKVIRLVKSSHLEDSAKNIKEYAEDMRAGGDKLQVVNIL